MRNFYILFFAFMLFGTSSCAAPYISGEYNSRSHNYGEAFIFVEHGVEFAVYPDGQFDFYYNPNNRRRTIVAPGFNMTFNSGYNYAPFVQYDDYGAVIQIENVPVFYDYYGRIIRAGDVFISYNRFGKIGRIGNLHISYNPYQQISHTSGFINVHNRNYTKRPWHSYYRRPYTRHVVVYNQPYRAYYYPERIAYVRYKNHYKKYRKSYLGDFYRPSDNISSYHRGRRASNVRDLSRINNFSESPRYSENNVRNNLSSDRNRKTYRKRENERNSNSNATVRSREIRNSSEIQSKTRRSTRSNVREREPEQRAVRRSRSSRSRSDAAVRTPSRASEPRTTAPRTTRSSRGRG